MRNFWTICSDLLAAIHGEDRAKANVLLVEAELNSQAGVAPDIAERRRAILENYKSMISWQTSKSIYTRNETNTSGASILASIRISLVTSVFNRFWQLKETLPSNLETIRNYQNIEIVLVDFGGSDSVDIVKMIEQNFCFDILSNRLKYFQAIEPWSKFHMAAAKNVAHRLAYGDYLFSIDADNYVSPDDINLVLNHFDQYPDSIFHQTIGPAPLTHRQWSRYQLFPSADAYHDDEVIWDGSCGRIAVSRKRFETVNGYNENFVGMGMDDIDFIIRSIRAGATYKHYQFTRPASTVFIDNGSAAKYHQHDDNETNWSRMDSALANNTLIPYYVTNSLPERFTPYMPAAVLASSRARVTLFSSIFRASAYIQRFQHDLGDILASTPDVVIWLLDVIGSHPPEISKILREMALHDRVYYLPVNKDPGLYALWNIALCNIRSTYTGNLNIDDLRGRQWLPECLSMLDSGLADLVSPVTIPFKEADVSSYTQALAMLRQNGAHVTRWFETRIVLEGNPVPNSPKHTSLVDGKYDHRDLFQVLPNGDLASYCIPNASPIWRRELHQRVGYFDEGKYGCFSDLALWIAASAAGMRLRQVNYPALFFISNDQAHRRQAKDNRRLWSLALQYGSDVLQSWASCRCFDLSRIEGSYGDHHFLGWNWVRDQVAAHFVNAPGHILLDMFVERNFFWNQNPDEKDFYYSQDWIGFVHTTPHQSEVYDKKSQNLNCLLDEAGFKRSLPSCKGLIVLSENNRAYLSAHLNKQGWQIPVYRLFHPNIPIDLTLVDAVRSEERSRFEGMVFHVGWHLRSFSAFAKLDIDKKSKVLLVPKKVSKDYFLHEVVNKDLVLAGLKSIDHYVDHIYTASQDEYQKILRWGIIFNHYLEPSGSNLISECISAETLLLINRHKAFEEYLGQDYPLFFDETISPDELIRRLRNPATGEQVREHLRQRQDRFSVQSFCRELERIGKHLYE